MDKITLKITNHQLDVLNHLILHCDTSPMDKTRNQKAAISVLQILSKRLRTLKIKKETKKNAFNVSFPYYEAFFLLNIINENMVLYHLNVYEYNVLLSIILELDKQLT